MDTITLILTLCLSSFIFTIPSLSANPCRPESCHDTFGPEIRFPFRLVDRQPASCGPPGFELYCNAENRTILNLPQSGSFVVDHIDYSAQALFINDPGSCLAGRILNFTASGSPFRGAYTRNYTFLNCSSDFMDYTSTQYLPLNCLNGRNHTVLAMRSQSPTLPATCRVIKSVVVPMEWTASQYYWASMDFTEDLELVWNQPLCRDCEIEGGVCGFKGDRRGSELACFRRSKSGE